MSNSSGFTLIELMVVVSVVGITILYTNQTQQAANILGQEGSEASMTNLILPLKVLRADLQRSSGVTSTGVAAPAPNLTLAQVQMTMVGGVPTMAANPITYSVVSGVPCPPPAGALTCSNLSRTEGGNTVTFPGLAYIAWCLPGDALLPCTDPELATGNWAPAQKTDKKRFMIVVKRMLSTGKPSGPNVIVVNIESMGMTGGNPATRPAMMRKK